MRKTIFLVSLLVFLALACEACKKLQPDIQGDGPIERIKVLPAIPAEHGELIAVTQHPTSPYWSALWFRKPDNTIAVVWVNISQGKVKPSVTIPRQ